MEENAGNVLTAGRINHSRGAITEFLSAWKPGTEVAVETIGKWYWIVDEIEAAGMVPRLVHARRAKMMLASVNKTDKLDCFGLNRLQRTGTLPTVWIPPAEIRDLRELPRTRMVLARQRGRLKNRIHATLAKYGIAIEGASNAFGKRGRQELGVKLTLLPTHSRFYVERLLEQLEAVQGQIELFEGRMKRAFGTSRELELLQTLPGVGFIPAVVILLKVGEVSRFPAASSLAAYSGTTPRVHASGDKIRYGRLRPDVNRYLKWAFVEAANVVCLNHRRSPARHVSRLYRRIRQRKGHQKAVGAVARHLAEATYWICKKEEPYREPRCQAVSSTKG
ncbi:MAG: IS110 family transposase [Spirochaetaceae bacterium]|nr:MAG: IS110 family transposase [Spirochaetaceae bacterium]